MPSFRIIGLLVLEKKIFKGFAIYRLLFPLPEDAPYKSHIKFGFDWPSGFRGEDVSRNIVDNNDYNDDGRWSMGIL